LVGRQPILLIVVRRGNRMNGRIGGERAKCRKCHGHVLQPRAGRAGCASYI
jgi:hypothetical protein